MRKESEGGFSWVNLGQGCGKGQCESKDWDECDGLGIVTRMRAGEHDMDGVWQRGCRNRCDQGRQWDQVENVKDWDVFFLR